MKAEISCLKKTTFKTIGVTKWKKSHPLFLFSICKWELLKIVAIANKIEEMINWPETNPVIPNINIKPINMSL